MKKRLLAHSNNCPKLRANRRILSAIEQAVGNAKMENCTVDEVHKDAMRLYLNTWVVGPLQAAIDDMTGKRKSRW